MATYPVVNTKTGEQKEVCKDNPDWLRDYSDPSTMPGVEVLVKLENGKIN